jgi:predicted O-methyltransferase YrrM
MDPTLRQKAEAAKGFMPADEGEALHAAAFEAARAHPGRPLLEVGTYCGKSAIYLGAAARGTDTVLFTVDHHHGSEENQAGWEHHDPTLIDPETNRFDTLPTFRRTIGDAGLEDVVVAVIGESTTVARHWTTPLAFLFIDGGHGSDVAWADYRAWTPKLASGGTLAIHDVFPDPADGGRPPYELYCEAISETGGYEERAATGSLRVLTKK